MSKRHEVHRSQHRDGLLPSLTACGPARGQRRPGCGGSIRTHLDVPDSQPRSRGAIAAGAMHETFNANVRRRTRARRSRKFAISSTTVSSGSTTPSRGARTRGARHSLEGSEEDSGCDPNDPTTWTKPVIRLGHTSNLFRKAANTPVLRRPSTSLSAQGDGRSSAAWAPFRCASLAWRSRRCRVGMSMSASASISWTSWNGAPVVVERARIADAVLFSDVGETDAPMAAAPRLAISTWRGCLRRRATKA